MARPLQLQNKPVTRVENYCATGSEALRQAAYAVASGAYDIAMALGAEKTKDSGFQGLNATPPPNDGTGRTLTAAAMFSMVSPAYGQKYDVSSDEMRQATAHVAQKNHANGARNPLAQFQREATLDTISAAAIGTVSPISNALFRSTVDEILTEGGWDVSTRESLDCYSASANLPRDTWDSNPVSSHDLSLCF